MIHQRTNYTWETLHYIVSLVPGDDDGDDDYSHSDDDDHHHHDDGD